MKKKRQQDIQKLINDYTIRNQTELTERLLNLGYDVTQATVSRDIKELKIIKTADETGALKYRCPKSGIDVSGDMELLSTLVKKVGLSVNLIVLKTLIGMAQGVAGAIDELSKPEILGTIAGDDTIMIVCTSEEEAKKMYEFFNEFVK